MGLGIVIIVHLIGIFILSLLIAAFARIVAYSISRKKSRKTGIITLISPFIALYTLYFAALAGSIIVSVYKKVDIGIGDAWYVPLSGTCQLLFIDVPENGFLECNGETIITDIAQIQVGEDNIYAKTNEDHYFSFNVTNSSLIEFSNEADFIINTTIDKITLKNATDYYFERRNEIAGTSLTIVGIISLLVSTFVVLIFIKIVLRIYRPRDI
ncbi:MAG: hypothetical protein H3C54_08860 [Taibaiella sp.]|nr:hypothetical protein [Taibaiella sp.]